MFKKMFDKGSLTFFRAVSTATPKRAMTTDVSYSRTFAKSDDDRFNRRLWELWNSKKRQAARETAAAIGRQLGFDKDPMQLFDELQKKYASEDENSKGHSTELKI